MMYTSRFTNGNAILDKENLIGQIRNCGTICGPDSTIAIDDVLFRDTPCGTLNRHGNQFDPDLVIVFFPLKRA